MLTLAVIVLLVYYPATWADTCASCKTAYVTPAAGDKCAVLKTYLTCLEGSGKGDDGCPLAAADAAVIQTNFTAASCTFTDTCICQKNFWKTDQSTTGEADTCSAIQTYITCLKGRTAMACDGSTSVTTLATGVETRIKALDTSACTITTTCQCEIDAAKADISTDDKKCTAYKVQFSCLSPLTTAPCAATTTLESLKAAASTSITSTTSCTVTTACQCELDAAKADISTDAKKCTPAGPLMIFISSPGCDDTTTKSAIATTAETERAALGASDCPDLSDTCQCEVDAAKGDASTSAKYCTVLATLKTCLSAITTTTEVGCTTLTQEALVNDTTTKITAAICGSYVDHVTYTMTSLIGSVLVHLFM